MTAIPSGSDMSATDRSPPQALISTCHGAYISARDHQKLLLEEQLSMASSAESVFAQPLGEAFVAVNAN
jgi:hypothetical protein